jgi:hypothetical protein
VCDRKGEESTAGGRRGYTESTKKGGERETTDKESTRSRGLKIEKDVERWSGEGIKTKRVCGRKAKRTKRLKRKEKERGNIIYYNLNCFKQEGEKKILVLDPNLFL